jgi:hypothetical protein
MTMLNDLRQLKTGWRELRRFGLIVGAVFAALGVLFWLRHKPVFPYLLIPGAVLMGSGLLFPRMLKEIYFGWMSLAFGLGFVMSNVILTLLFLFVITPIGLAARCLGKDFLGLKLNRQATTYWIRRERLSKSKADYEQQF